MNWKYALLALLVVALAGCGDKGDEVRRGGMGAAEDTYQQEKSGEHENTRAERDEREVGAEPLIPDAEEATDGPRVEGEETQSLPPQSQDDRH